ncbi:folylpolyglutamate synthase, partial [Coemansia nantahalensis]
MSETARPGGIALGLERITRFLSTVLPYDPRGKLRIVHVAGTNGKGSVCALVSEALAAAGYRVGTFNSPHFLEPNDALRIRGTPIPAAEYDALREWIRGLDAAAQPPNGPLSLFEQTTAAAFWWFAERSVDIAVVEVGMGGRRDATNVFGAADGKGIGQSLVQCICPVDNDHVGVIGSTVEEIAREKCGIMRPESWIVIANQDRADAFHKIRQHALRTSPGRIINVRRQPSYDIHVPDFSIKQAADKPARVEIDLPLVLPGYHQAGNASVAFYALDVLRTNFGFTKLTDTAIQVGFQNVRWPGRLSWLNLASRRMAHSGEPRPLSSDGGNSAEHDESLANWLLADGAHNEPAAVELRKYVDTTLRRIAQQRSIRATRGRSNQGAPHVRWIIGFSKGKDMAAILGRLLQPGDAVWAVPFAQPKDMPWIACEDPRAIGRTAGGPASCGEIAIESFDCLAAAVDRLAADASDDRLNVVCGSLYLVAD